jgi:hypothetical protein
MVGSLCSCCLCSSPPALVDGSSGSREAECEGGEGFYVAQTDGRVDLLVSLPGERFRD